MEINPNNMLLSVRDVQRLTTLSRATVYRYVAAGQFPKPVQLGPSRVAWRLSEVQKWNESPLDWGRDPFFDA